MSLDQIIGACVAVIVAGMPAMVALLKIKELHIAVNSALSAFIAATKQQAEERIAATKLESDVHFQDLKREIELVRHRNDQLLDQLAETVKRLPVAEKTPGTPPC
ncbi:MAG: hypothetical protein ACXWPK_10195 [Isosphaeraceae bacterium]